MTRRSIVLWSVVFFATVASALLSSCGDDDSFPPCGPVGCGSVCVDLMTNEANCGRCGAACGPGSMCSDGICSPPDDGTRVACDGEIVNTTRDPDHCGGCVSTCARGEICAESDCRPGCTGEGLEMCGDRCVALATDEESCGACGNACVPGAICTDGSCACLVGLTRCDDACTDVTRDERHCGACNVVCEGTCVDGVCAAI